MHEGQLKLKIPRHSNVKRGRKFKFKKAKKKFSKRSLHERNADNMRRAEFRAWPKMKDERSLRIKGIWMKDPSKADIIGIDAGEELNTAYKMGRRRSRGMG